MCGSERAVPQHVPPELPDKAAVLGHRDEFRWLEQAEAGVLPTDEGLRPDHRVVRDCDDRLQVHPELGAGDDRGAQVLLEVKVLERTETVLRPVVELDPGPAATLGPLQCLVALGDELIGMALAAGIDDSTDADRQGVAGVLGHQGVGHGTEYPFPSR